METANTQTIVRPNNFDRFTNDGGGELAQKRLNALLEINAETARIKSLFASEQEKIEAATIENPLSNNQAFAYFGLLLGVFPPAAFFARFLMGAGNFNTQDAWIIGVLIVVNLISAIVGYFSGKLVGNIVAHLENLSWTKMLLVLPFVGLLWGVLAGGAGGVIIFVIGAIFGALLGAMVGGVALPVFTIFHRMLKKGDIIDRRHFLPFAFGVTFMISAFILGL